MNFGAATLTTTAYTPDVARLVIGVNNTFQFINNDSQGGGVFHSATAKTCPQTCPFDTGVVGFNVTKGRSRLLPLALTPTTARSTPPRWSGR